METVYQVRSIQRSLDMLDALGQSPSGLRLVELTKAIGLPESTVYRLLENLCSRGYVQQDADTGAYYLGLQIVRLQGTIIQRLKLETTAVPFLKRLVEETQMTVNLAVLSNGKITYLYNDVPSNRLALPTPLGYTAPAQCTALGKVLLAGLSPEELQQTLPILQFEPRTPNTIMSLRTLERELALTRERGYAVDDEENLVGVRCIAATVRDHLGRVIAAISLAAPATLMRPEHYPALAQKVLATADCISAEFGYRMPPAPSHSSM